MRRGSGTMTTRIIEVASISQSDVERWRALTRHATDPYPFLDPRLLVPAAALLPRAADIRVLVAEEGDRFLALMPITVQPRGLGPFPIVSTRHRYLDDESGWDHPLVDAERPVEAMAGLLRGLDEARLPGLVDFAQLPAGGPLHHALTEAAASLGVPLWERERQLFVYSRRSDPSPDREELRDPEEPDFLFEHFGYVARKHHRRWSRGLQGQVGGPLRLIDRSDDPSAIDDFIDLEASGWKGDPSRGGWGIRVRGATDWVTEMTARFRQDGDLAVLALVGGDDLVFMSISFRLGGTAFGYATAYDERFSKMSAGTLGVIATVNRMLSLPGVTAFDPNYEIGVVQARRLYADERPRVRVLGAHRGAIPRLVVRVVPGARALRRRLVASR